MKGNCIVAECKGVNGAVNRGEGEGRGGGEGKRKFCSDEVKSPKPSGSSNTWFRGGIERIVGKAEAVEEVGVVLVMMGVNIFDLEEEADEVETADCGNAGEDGEPSTKSEKSSNPFSVAEAVFSASSGLTPFRFRVETLEGRLAGGCKRTGNRAVVPKLPSTCWGGGVLKDETDLRLEAGGGGRTGVLDLDVGCMTGVWDSWSVLDPEDIVERRGVGAMPAWIGTDVVVPHESSTAFIWGAPELGGSENFCRLGADGGGVSGAGSFGMNADGWSTGFWESIPSNASISSSPSFSEGISSKKSSSEEFKTIW